MCNIMQNIISSHTGFQPLKEVWLGDVYPSHFYKHFNNETQDIFLKLTEMTQQDLTDVEKKLSELGVLVQRPQFDQQEDYLDDVDNLIKPPITPRDWAITLGDTLHIIPQYASGKEPFQPAISAYCNNNQKVKILNRSLPNQDPMVWVQFPAVVRVGRDLYIDYNNTDEWQKNSIEKVIEEYSKNYRVHITHTGDHSDAVFCPISPGQIFSTHYRRRYNDTFPNWDVFFLNDTTKHRKSNGWNNNWQLPEMDYPGVNEKIINYAKQWLGNPQETVFEVNMLVVDEKNVICIAEDDAACKKLELLGITPHVVEFKTRSFWDGGIHCLTVDINREGPCIDYWPERGPNGTYRYHNKSTLTDERL